MVDLAVHNKQIKIDDIAHYNSMTATFRGFAIGRTGRANEPSKIGHYILCDFWDANGKSFQSYVAQDDLENLTTDGQREFGLKPERLHIGHNKIKIPTITPTCK